MRHPSCFQGWGFAMSYPSLQGRMQLKAFQDANGNPSWGSADNPNCRGFTPEEFQSLDFGKMDLSEYFADITTKANAAIQQDMKNNVQNYYYNLP